MSWLPIHNMLHRLHRIPELLDDGGRRKTLARRTSIRTKDIRHPAAGLFAVPTHLFFLSIGSLLLVISLCGALYAGQVTLAWDPNGGAEVVGYRVYYGTDGANYSSFIDVGNQTSGVLTNLQEGAVYYAVATSYDAQGTESSYSNQVSFVATSNAANSGSGSGSDGGGGGGGGGGGCFIATAAFGSYMDPHVRTLRSFRDICLLTNAPGRLFVRLYYTVSPSIADVIRGNEILRAGVRVILLPAVGFGYFSVAMGFWPAALLTLLFLVFFTWCGGRLLFTRAARP